jgi:hypothetical protein
MENEIGEAAEVAQKAAQSAQEVEAQIDTREPYEPPHITVIGTFDELTKVKGTQSNDGPGGTHKSV